MRLLLESGIGDLLQKLSATSISLRMQGMRGEEQEGRGIHAADDVVVEYIAAILIKVSLWHYSCHLETATARHESIARVSRCTAQSAEIEASQHWNVDSKDCCSFVAISQTLSSSFVTPNLPPRYMSPEKGRGIIET